MPDGHRYRNLHGHSFRAEVELVGETDPVHGWICDFDEFSQTLSGIQSRLDHYTLNDIAGLEQPTLEHIAGWIFVRLSDDSRMRSVTVWRDSLGERAKFER